MLHLRSFCLALVLAACSSTEQPEVPAAIETPAAPVELDGWRSERIALPPEFAPSLPQGEELLLFAPGMFDAQAEDFWSYVFLMQIEWSDIDAHRLTTLFEAYFDGLLLAVAEGRGADIGTNPAHVDVLPIDDEDYSIEVLLVDAFSTLETVKLHILVKVKHDDVGGLLLEVQASPQAEGHPIWRDLGNALDSLSL